MVGSGDKTTFVLAIKNKMLVPNGVHYRGVLLYFVLGESLDSSCIQTSEYKTMSHLRYDVYMHILIGRSTRVCVPPLPFMHIRQERIRTGDLSKSALTT